MKKTIYTFLTLLVVSMAGCKDDFFDINENPNLPTEGSITPNLILPRVLHATAARMATSYDYSAHWMGYWARSGSYGTSAEQESYSITTGFQADEWSGAQTATSANGWYDILADVDKMQKMGEASGEAFYVATAKVIKAIGFMYLVDQYNNVPYSKAFDLSGNILPAYDKGQDIYNDLLVQLDEAAALFATAEISDAAYNADIMFGANPDLHDNTVAKEKLMWRKLANTMRLKLLIHESEVVSASTVSDVIAKINADGSGFIASNETAAVQPGYQASDLQQNPYYDTYKITALGAPDNYNRANNYILGKYRNNNDVRYEYVFSEAQTPIGNNIYYGYNFGEVIPNNAPSAVNSSDVAGPGLAASPSQAQWLFTSVESLFLQAEAIQRGWIPGSAESAYNNAVRESFSWLGAPSADADEYLGQTNNTIVSWSLAQDKIKLIAMQRYLALIGINNFEAYVDYRRLGVPTDLPLSLYSGRNSNNIPLRMLYPQNEYNYNAANVAAEGVIDAQTSRIFWDK